MSRDEWTEYRGDALKAVRKSKDRRMVKKSGKQIVCFHCGEAGTHHQGLSGTVE